MKPQNNFIFACRHCQFYNPEGRRGGICSQLGVLVKAEWESCHLAILAFNNEWQTVPEIAMLEKSFSLGCATPSVNLEMESTSVTTAETKVSSDVMISKSV
ncbi:hypothetical protein [Geminocystis sp. GBBB08]|uniref:hypothetical protein n=1 Tax=Geminocystis sp. GBBB08 TaxID=2604140 RepID=UPI0027E2F787|nr:hypothetical protein [Geminocystis sp. GBBB08]MBL1209775.1 hypothetical protein [Geminocystis sp. GBBB08]